jgi:methionine aminopeptidase
MKLHNISRLIHMIAKLLIEMNFFCRVGRVFHTTPNVLHYKNKQKSGVMAYGHTFTIEPMICLGASGLYFSIICPLKAINFNDLLSF